MNQYTSKDLKSFYESIPQQVVELENKRMLEENEKQFEEFISQLKNGFCYLCNEEINSFDKYNFCLHWFIIPNIIKKKYFDKELNNQEFSFFRMESYFRWLAHTENSFHNIIDLQEEMSNNSYYEATIKYKNIEWSFSIGNTDLEGHSGASIGSEPHYHLQMLVDSKPFIRFNDFHINFTDEDLFNIEFMRQNSIKRVHLYGQGMSILEDENNLELIDQNLTIIDDFENATFFTSTIIQAPEGELIKGETIQKAMQLSKETGKPFSHFMRELAPKASILKVIQPGDGVPEISKRSGKK